MFVNITKLRQDIVEAGKRMYNRGFVAANDGNISARIDEKRILITPSGVSKGFMHEDDLIIIDTEGRVLQGKAKPSSESLMHLKIYQHRPDINGICHAHPPYSTGFAVAGIPLDQCILSEVIISLGEVPIAKYATPGSSEFYKPIVTLIKNHDAVLLANHGAVTVGKDVLASYFKLETLEHTANITFVAHQLGGAENLGNDQVEKLTSLRDNFGITTKSSCNINSKLTKNKNEDIDSIIAKVLAELKLKR